MANLIPRNAWGFPPMRLQSLMDDIDDLTAFSPTDTNAVSISEDDQHIHVEAALPGVEPEDVEVTFNRGMLWISGQAREEEKDKKKKYYRQAARQFSYRIAVPGDVDFNVEPQADCEKGIIKVTFQKSQSSMPKKITLKKGKSNGEKKKEKE